MKRNYYFNKHKTFQEQNTNIFVLGAQMNKAAI